MIRAVLFDRDDTLSVMDSSAPLQVSQWIAAQYHLPVEEVHQGLVSCCLQLFGGWWALRTLEDEQRFWRHYAHGLAAELKVSQAEGETILAQFPYQVFMKPAKGAVELLTELKRRGFKTGVLSNTLPNIWPTLEASGLAQYCDVALSSCQLGVHKPELEAFTLAASALGVPCAEVLFLDDRWENIAAARVAGMQAELVDLHGKTRGALKLSGVLKVLDVD